MAEDKKKGGDFALPSAGILTLALAVLGLIWSGPSPLINERPSSQTKSDADKGKIQDIDARMWQDPLEAIQKEAKESPPRQRNVLLKQAGKNELRLVIQEEGSPGKEDHLPASNIRKAFIDKPVKNILMLAVMLPGGPYPEEEEGRRRKRYAVLSALATLDYAPKETEHIGYFKIKKQDELGLPEAVPFELFDKGLGSQRRGVIVLWLDDSNFDQRIKVRIKKVFDLAKPDTGDAEIKLAVIGPNKSNHLKTLIEDTAKESEQSNEISFFAAGATVEHSHLVGSDAPDDLKKYNPIKNLWRTIGSDGDISSALVKELKLRQVNPETDHVLLISEWDSFYGRSFPKTFAKEYAKKETECLPMDTINIKDKPEGTRVSNVYCVNYMRGIDGLLPEGSSKTDAGQDAPKKSETIQVNNNIDRPSGNNQKDYLRRLVDRVRKLDENIRNSKIPCPVKNNGISAIGVLGSDVYDKLMILQALRSYFPGKIFFTTDLDAAYFSPQEQPYTHNLIVGSSFGLNLAPELQMAIPSFRDSYQTAVFFSTKLAATTWEGKNNDATEKLGEKDIPSKLNGWLNEPRIFEIGRKGSVDLSKENPSSNPGNCKQDIRNCEHIHPAPDIGPGMNTSISVIVLKLSSLVLGLLLLYRVSWTFRWLPTRFKGWVDQLQETSSPVNNGQEVEQKPANVQADMQEAPAENIALPTRRNWTKAWVTHLIALTSMLPLVMVGLLIIGAIYLALITIGKDEPSYWGNGVSIWPSNLLILIALLLSVEFCKRIRHQLKESDEKLEKDFCLNDGESQPNSQQFLTVHTWEHRNKNASGINVVELWKDYQNYGERSARFWRSALNTFIFMLFGLTAIMLSGGLPVPARGNSFYIDVFLETACVIAVVFLIMWVVDAARLFSKFIMLLAEDKKSDWPNIGDKKWGWLQNYEDYVAYWIDIQFVAQYTKAMEKFIWYPIPPLLLMGTARSSVFDNWTFSAGLLASVAILLLYLFSIAFLLQYGAKEMRTKAVKKLGEELRKLRGQTEIDEKKIAQLEKMIGEIKDNEEGAFTPFLRQPMVQALLAFLSGSGSLVVLLDRFF